MKGESFIAVLKRGRTVAVASSYGWTKVDTANCRQIIGKSARYQTMDRQLLVQNTAPNTVFDAQTDLKMRSQQIRLLDCTVPRSRYPNLDNRSVPNTVKGYTLKNLCRKSFSVATFWLHYRSLLKCMHQQVKLNGPRLMILH